MACDSLQSFFQKKGSLLRKEKKNLEHSNIFESEFSLGYSFDISKSTRSIFSILGGGLYRYAPQKLQEKNSVAPTLKALFLSGKNEWRAQILLDYSLFSLFFAEKDELRLRLALRYTLAKDLEGFIGLEQRKNYKEASLGLLIRI